LVTPGSLHRKCFYFKTDKTKDEDYFVVVLKEGEKARIDPVNRESISSPKTEVDKIRSRHP